MNSQSRLYGAAGLAAIAACLSTPVLAAGTVQGTSIKNDVSVAYKVGGVDQTAAIGSDTFVVDRKISMTIANAGTAATPVGPGGTAAVAFTVTNTSNDTLDFALAATNGGAAKHGTTDNYDVTAFKYHRETGTTAGYDPTDTEITFLDEIAPDANVVVYVVATTATAQKTGDGAIISLRATARDDAGANLVETTGANTAVVDNVFAEDLALADGNAERRNGSVFDTGDYKVLAAAINATKTSTLVSDPVNGVASATVFPKAIPGAVVEYCIAVANGAGSADATNVAVTDTLPPLTAYLAGSIVVGATCSDAGTTRTDGSGDADGASAVGNLVSGTLPTITGGQTRTLRFRATIN